MSVPGVGFGLGFDRTIEAMAAYGLLPEATTHAQILVSIFDPKYLQLYVEYAQQLREKGINVEIYSVYTDKLAKQFKYADRKGIAYVLIAGEDEIQNGLVSMKNMHTGDQQQMKLQDIPSLLKQHEG